MQEFQFRTLDGETLAAVVTSFDGPVQGMVLRGLVERVLDFTVETCIVPLDAEVFIPGVYVFDGGLGTFVPGPYPKPTRR